MTRSVPQTLRPAPEGAVFNEEGPARTLNRRSWFHVQAKKADKPRLSACTSKRLTPPLSGCGFLPCHSRWPLAPHTAWASESQRMAGFAVTG